MLGIPKDEAHTLVWYKTRRVEIHGTSLTDEPVWFPNPCRSYRTNEKKYSLNVVRAYSLLLVFCRWALGSSPICLAINFTSVLTTTCAAAGAMANIKAQLSHALFLVEFLGRSTRVMFDPAIDSRPASLPTRRARRHRQPSKWHPLQLHCVLTLPSLIHAISTLFEWTRVPPLFVPLGNEKPIESWRNPRHILIHSISGTSFTFTCILA